MGQPTKVLYFDYLSKKFVQNTKNQPFFAKKCLPLEMWAESLCYFLSLLYYMLEADFSKLGKEKKELQMIKIK